MTIWKPPPLSAMVAFLLYPCLVRDQSIRSGTHNFQIAERVGQWPTPLRLYESPFYDMTNDLTALVDFYEREKDLKREQVVSALEFAFLSAYKKMVPGAESIEQLDADIDLKSGKVVIKATLIATPDDEITDQFNQVALSTAEKRKPGAEAGDAVEFNVTPKDFGRIAVQTAKQTMMQRLRQAEKAKIIEIYSDRAGDIVSGTVRRFERGDVWVDLGQAEGLMPNRERVNTEEYNIGDRIRVYVVAVEDGNRGPEIILSRSHPNLVRRLFEAEVSEIADHSVELKAIAREAGFRTKVAVTSADPKIDPVGACVGMRGVRVKNIVRELNNEKVDIIEWSDDPREMVVQALKPAELRSIEVDEEKKVVHVTVDEEHLPKAIGRRGQNARLSSRLMGWDVQVSQDHSVHEAFVEKVDDASGTLAEQLGLSPEKGRAVFTAGGISVDMVAAMDVDYLVSEAELTEEEAEKALEEARKAVASAEEGATTEEA